jgi:hypothetical protein
LEPLEAIAVPTHGVLVVIDAVNSWPAGTAALPVRLAYIATDSTQRLSFVSLHAATHPGNILRIASRPSNFDDMPYGLVVELYLTHDLAEDESVHLALAHAGATAYYPPQQIDDHK